MAKRRKPSDEAAAPLQAPVAKAPANTPAAAATGYAPALNAGFQATAARVQEMHQAIAGQTFDHLLRVPGLSMPTRLVQSVHDAISQGVYAAVRHGGGAALSLAADAERLALDPARVPGAKEQALRGALSGAFGDSLQASGSALAVQMGLHARGLPLPLTQPALAALRPRVCVFIHGLACDEQSWALRTDAWRDSSWAHALPDGDTIQYGALLEHELDLSAIYLRYNTGLAIDANAQQLATLLEHAALAAPQVEQWVLIGHSMGGLVARRAHEIAATEALRWAQHTPMIVCLGSPHQGAALEKLGHALSVALDATEVTKPLARVANARSRGVKDMRRGLKGSATPSAAPLALRLIFATLGDASNSVIGPLLGQVFGDGLVRARSAADDGLTGDVQRVELAGLGHMGLLNHPRVYAEIRRWLGAADIIEG